MPIAERTLSRWSHHQAAKAFKQAHVPVRKALEAHKGLEQFTYEVFLQGSYKNDTNLGGDSDVDVVIRLAHKLDPNVVALAGAELQQRGRGREHEAQYGVDSLDPRIHRGTLQDVSSRYH